MRLLLWVVNLVGGLAVLGSYAHGILTHEEPGRALWGGVPSSLRPLYQICMLLATAGYFAFSGFLLFAVPPETTRIAGRWGYGALVPIHALFLIASALWMPLTFRYLAAPTTGGWIAVRAVLFATGIGALALIAALATIEPREPRWSWALALVGACAFALQTAILDGLVWPALFRR